MTVSVGIAAPLSVRGPRIDAARSRRGFSLVEVLLAVFILGIGVISIAAIFPAGITLQLAQSNDDVLGPVVAKNAMALLQFAFDSGGLRLLRRLQFLRRPVLRAGQRRAQVLTVEGDWPWMRPGFLFDDPTTPGDEGAIDIFSQQFTRRGEQPEHPFTGLDVATEIPLGWPSVGAGSSGAFRTTPRSTRSSRAVRRPATSRSGSGSSRAAVLIEAARARYWPMGSDLAGTTSEPLRSTSGT